MTSDRPNSFGLEEEYFDSYLDLLTREEELQYAKDIERTRREFTHAILSTPLGIQKALELLHEVHNGNLPFSRYIRSSETEPAYDKENNGHMVSISEEAIQKRFASTLRTLNTLITQDKLKEAADLALTLPLNIDKFHIPVLNELRKMSHSCHLQHIEKHFADLNEARHNLANGNHRLVKSITKYWMGRGVSRADLCGEGEVGLLKAIDKFEWRKGFKFSTYATWQISQSMQRTVQNNASTICVPAHHSHLLSVVGKCLPRFLELFGRDPRHTDADIARLHTLSGLSQEDLHEYFRILRIRSTRNFDDLLQSNKPNKGNSEKDTRLGSILADPKGNRAPIQAQTNEIRAAVVDCLRTIHITNRLPFKIRRGIALSNEDASIAERPLVEAFIRYRNGKRLRKGDTRLLRDYLALQGKTLDHLRASPLGRATQLSSADERYIGSILAKKTEEIDGKRKTIIQPVHVFEGAEYTLEEVATIFDVTRERIRQLEAKVLAKLTDSEYRRDMLAPFARAQSL